MEGENRFSSIITMIHVVSVIDARDVLVALRTYNDIFKYHGFYQNSIFINLILKKCVFTFQ